MEQLRNVSMKSSGIGDVISGLYVVQALLNEGFPVTYYSTQPNWAKFFTNAQQKHIREIPYNKKVEELYTDYEGELSNYAIRKHWYAQMIGEYGLKPQTPETNDFFEKAIQNPKEEGDYVVLLPYSNWHTREWNHLHWLGLEQLIENELGLRCVILGNSSDASKMQQFSGMRYWGQQPEMVINLLYHANSIIGIDSGLVHLAGVFHEKVIAIHSHISGERLFSETNIQSIQPKTVCVNCGFKPENGYRWNCDYGCWALQSLSPFDVMNLLEKVTCRTPNLVFQN